MRVNPSKTQNHEQHPKHARKHANNWSTLSGSSHCSRANTPVEKGYKLQKGRTYRIYRCFCPMSVSKSHGRRTQPTNYVVRVSFCGLLSKGADLCRGLNGQSVPCARREEANQPRPRAPPPPHSLHHSFFMCIQQFACHHLPAPNTSVNKNNSYMIAFPNRKINKYLVRGATYIFQNPSK